MKNKHKKDVLDFGFSSNGSFRFGSSCMSTEIIFSCSDRVAVQWNFSVGFGSCFDSTSNGIFIFGLDCMSVKIILLGYQLPQIRGEKSSFLNYYTICTVSDNDSHLVTCLSAYFEMKHAVLTQNG